MSLFTNAVFISEIGEGSFGKIDKYKLSNGMTVAIKTFFPGDNEGIASSALHVYQIFKECPNIIQCLDISISIDMNNIIVKVMMPYHTSDMKKFIEMIAFLERLKYSETIILQLLTGLYQLYERGIIHGDIKPENILVDYEYDKEYNKLVTVPQVYIADFGNSIQLPCNKKYRNLASDNETYTFIYRPPELLNNNSYYNDKADIWAIGITLVEYFLGKHFIKNAAEISRNKIVHELFSNISTINTDVMQDLLSKLLSNYNIYDIENFNIRGYLNVENILKSNMSSFHFNMISNDTIILLIRMLAIDPIDRVSITELMPNVEICKFIDNSFKRGIPIDISISKYTYLVEYMIEIAIMFKHSYITIISAIDLFDRYISNYASSDNTNKYFLLIIGACLLLSSKHHESYSPELSDYVFVSSNEFGSDELMNMEIVILQRMNYNIISCEIDDYVYEFGKNPDLNILKSVYYSISKDNKYASSLSYSEIINYLNNVL